MITVKVVSKSTGKPVKGKKVSVSFDGILSGGSSKQEYTDTDGEAHFDNNPGKGRVYVDGSTKHEGHIAGRVVVYL